MAREETFTVVSKNVSTLSGSFRSMLDLLNTSTTHKVKIYRIWCTNARLSTVTGVPMYFWIEKINGRILDGSVVTPQPHDTNDTLVDGITAQSPSFPTVTGEVFLSFLVSSDEAATSVFTWDEVGTLPEASRIWSAGYYDQNISPIVLYSNQGIHIKQLTLSNTGIFDLSIEFTQVAL